MISQSLAYDMVYNQSGQDLRDVINEIYSGFDNCSCIKEAIADLTKLSNSDVSPAESVGYKTTIKYLAKYIKDK